MVNLNDDELNGVKSRAKLFGEYVTSKVHVSILNLPAYEEAFSDYFKSLKTSKIVHKTLNGLAWGLFAYSLGQVMYDYHTKDHTNPVYEMQSERRQLTEIISLSPILYDAGVDTAQVNTQLRNRVKTLDSEIEELMKTESGKEVKKDETSGNRSLYALYGAIVMFGISALNQRINKSYSKHKTRKKLAGLTSKQLANNADLEVPKYFE